MNRHTKQMTENQRFVKLKEVQASTQSQRFCTTFNFTPTHPSPPTTLEVDTYLENEQANRNS